MTEKNPPRNSAWSDSPPDRDRLLALPRDPLWIAGSFELTPASLDRVRTEHRENRAQLVLRLLREQEDEPAAEVPCDLSRTAFYLRAPVPGCRYSLALGLKHTPKDFQTIVRSNEITLPRGAPSGSPSGILTGAGSFSPSFRR